MRQAGIQESVSPPEQTFQGRRESNKCCMCWYHGLVLIMNMFRNKDAKPDMLRTVRAGSSCFMFMFPMGRSFPKVWEVSECMDRTERGGESGLQPVASHSGLVPSLTASICLFSVVC